MARNVRSAREFTVTRVMVANTVTGATFAVPGMRVTLAELRSMVADRELSGTVQVYCDACGESVVDCPDTMNSVPEVPAWSWRHDDTVGVRHVDGLVTFTG